MHPTLPFFPCVCRAILYVCVSIPALQIGSSAPFFLDSMCMREYTEVAYSSFPGLSL